MTNGATDPLPEYYMPIKIAKYYGVSPLEVIEWPKYMIQATIAVIQADQAVEEKQRKKAERKRGAR